MYSVHTNVLYIVHTSKPSLFPGGSESFNFCNFLGGVSFYSQMLIKYVYMHVSIYTCLKQQFSVTGHEKFDFQFILISAVDFLL